MVAAAAPEPELDSAEQQTSLSLGLPALGGAKTLTLYARQSSETVSIPVSAGLTPRELRARVELPIAIAEATLTVTDHDEILAEVRIGHEDEEVVVPLAGVDVSENTAVVTMSARLVPVPGVCVDDLERPLRLLDPVVVFSGVETPPATVADFLPPILARLQIFVPADPSRAEADAAVGLGAAIVAYYGQQPVRVTLHRLVDGDRPTVAAAPMERQIVIDEQGEPGLSLTPGGALPVLRLGGPAAELRNQTRLLTSDLLRIAVASGAVAGPLRPSPQLAADVTALRDIGELGATAVALANPTVTIGIDQVRLGRPARDVGVRLTGSYTPLPAALGGQVVVSAAGEVLAHWPTEPSGTIDRWVDIPDRLLRRFTDLTVRVEAAGNTGSCGEFQPITLTIDGSSPIRSKRADPPIPAGFQSLPQALMPKVRVGAGAGDQVSFQDTNRALLLLTGLQRLSAVPLAPELTSFDDALNSADPAVLLAADGWAVQEPQLPLQVDGKRVEVAGFGPDGLPTALTLSSEVAFGSLQVLRDGERTLLVATSTGAPERPIVAELRQRRHPGPIRWGATDKSVAAWFVAVSIALLAPTLPVLLVTAGWSAARRGEAAVVAVPVLVFGAVLAFQAVSYVTGSTFGFMRFYITAIPLAVFLAVLSLPARDRPVAKRVGRHARPAPDPPARGADRMSVLVSVLIAVGLPVTAWGMTQARYAPQEFALEAVLLPDPSDTTTRRAGQNAIIASFSTERQLAEYLDDQDLPRGSVLLDTVYGFAVLAATRNPDAFVIPSDYDFVEVLGDPAAAGVRYLLTVPNSGRGESDALNRQYPTVYDNGAGIATLDLEVPNDGADQPDWRVYRVLDQATP